MTTPSIVLISACLLGIKSRYDGQCKPNKYCLEMAQKGLMIPICPEQLGGLATPRIAANIVGGDGNDVLEGNAKVITRDGDDVTENFINGAQQVLKIAQMQNVNTIFLKSKSPSCGVKILGVMAALLKKNGFELHEF
jgi:uncharacterized protein YbbK (DUF523 family)